jgi:hypothetical protein
MYTIYNHFNNHHLFRSGFLIGSGIAFIISGSIYLLFGSYYMIKYGFENI